MIGSLLHKRAVFLPTHTGLTKKSLLTAAAAADNQETIASLPRAIKKGTYVVNGTTKDDITLWTVPSGINLDYVVVTVTNTDYATNKALPIATYIDGNRKIHAKMNVSRVIGYCRVSFVVWYWGD